MTTNGDAERDTLKTMEAGRLGWMALALTPEMGPTRIARAMERLGANATGRGDAGISRGGAGV